MNDMPNTTPNTDPWPSALSGRPAKVRKARRWPWAVTAVVVGIAIGAAGCGTGGSATPTTTAQAPAAPASSATIPAATVPAVEAPAAPTAPAMTTGQANAVRKAESYLAYTAFSRSGLIKQLKFENFSTADATYAVDHVTVDWTEQADKKAEDYMSYTAFSRDGLIKQLKFEGFTAEQAAHGATSVGL